MFNDKKQDVTQFLQVDKAIRPNHKMKKVNIDFPVWVVENLDKKADHLGITRQSLIKVWIAERLEEESK